MPPLNDPQAEKVRQAIAQGKTVFLRYRGEPEVSDRQVRAVTIRRGIVRALIQSRIMNTPDWVSVKDGDVFHLTPAGTVQPTE